MKKKINWVIVLAVIMLVASSFTFGWKFNESKNTFTENTTIESTLRSNVNKFSDEIGIRNPQNITNLNNARNYIMEQLKSCGYEIKVQEFDDEGVTVSNIIGHKKGTGNNKQTIVIGADYYSNSVHSADASVSGIATMLTTAKAMKNINCSYDIEFVAFANSQRPYNETQVIGSSVYVDSMKSKNTDIKGAIILDCIGKYTNNILTQRYPFIGIKYPNRGNFLAMMGDEKSKNFNEEFTNKFKSKSDFPVIQTNSEKIMGVSQEDNYSFWKAGIPAILVTDTGIYRNEDLNGKRDTKDKLNYKAMTEIIQTIVDSLSSY